MWTIGIPQKDYVKEIIEDADLGNEQLDMILQEYAQVKWNKNVREIKIIHVDEK